MFRSARPLRLHVPQRRVGIFPLHLDPPTVQHREIFRILAAGHRDPVVLPLSAAAASGGGSVAASSSLSSSLASSHPLAVHPYLAAAGGGVDSTTHEQLARYFGFGALRQANASAHPSVLEQQRHANRLHAPAAAMAGGGSEPFHDATSAAAAAADASNGPIAANFTATLAADIDDFSSRLRRLRFGDFDELILVPNTRYPVTIRQSSHLAAMAQLATRDIPRVSIDFTALEHHDESMPVISDLVSKYGSRATLLHWLPDAHEMQTWKDFHEIEQLVPFVLLCPTGYAPQSQDLRALLDTAREGHRQYHHHHHSSSHSPPYPDTPHTPLQDATEARPTILKRSGGKKTAGTTAFGNRLAPKTCEVVELRRWSGADVRQKLWERSLDPELLIPQPVLRYMDSVGLYRDFRKGYFTPMSSPLSANRTNSVAVAHHNPSADSTVAFSGLIPRLELHYDPNNLLAREQYSKLKQFECVDGQEPDLIVPIGGDGYMMHSIRRHWRRFIPFYGVNAGHVGYLLNDAGTIEELFSAPLKLHAMSMLYCEAEAESSTGEKRKIVELAFNDAWVERASGQTALIRVLVNGTERLRRVRGDGVLVSTAAGSTAYSQALGASPVPVGVPLIQLVGSNVVHPANWKPVHLNQEDIIELECVDVYKRPCKGYVDSVDVGIVSRMTIRTSRVAQVQIAFSQSCDLQQKLYSLQFPKG